MNKYKVKLSELAKNRMNEIFEYIEINLCSKQNAQNQYIHIANAILSLAYMPERIKLVNFEPERSQGIRRMLVDNYSIFFYIDEKNLQVNVSTILYSKSNLEVKLKQKN